MSRGFVHRVTVKNPTGHTVDDEGVPTVTYESFTVEGHVELTGPTSETPVDGADRTANVPGRIVEAIAAIPSGVTVAVGAKVSVRGTKNRMGDGEWEITSVQQTRLHQRLRLVRRAF